MRCVSVKGFYTVQITRHLDKLLVIRGGHRQSELESEWVGGFWWSRIPNHTVSRSRIFCPTPTPDVQLDHFCIKLLNWDSCWNGTISFKTFVETEISCCAPRFPLILTDKFHLFCVKESESEILERWESENLESRIWKFWKGQSRSCSRSRIFYLRLRNPGHRWKFWEE